MAQMQRGFRDLLNKHFDITKEIVVAIEVNGNSTYDSCCFGVDSQNKLSDESYMVFYNQLKSLNNEIVMNETNGVTAYMITLSKLPTHIGKLVFTVSIDDDGTMGQIKSLKVKIFQQGAEELELNLLGSEFSNEKAVIAIEIYQKDSWRVAAVASGFNGGLSALLQYYGGEEVATPTPVVNVPNKVSLEKRLEEEAPKLVSLAKPLKVSLEKHNLTDTVAQVALLLDISGSMTSLYKRGTVQKVIDKIVPLAMQFDDNGEFELWYFGSNIQRKASVTIRNYASTSDDWKTVMGSLGGGTNLAPAMQEVVEEYENSKIPAYVLCITDGATAYQSRVKDIMKKSSSKPIFWQFIGLGKNKFGILEELDTMSGRVVDNANFFSLNDIETIDPTELYSKMLAEFPIWLKEAKKVNIF